MASAGKKKKKNWITVPLSDVVVGQTFSRKSWADSSENDLSEYDYGRKIDKVVLPTAPRSARAQEEDAKIPQDPPFMAHLTNLPYDMTVDELSNFFQDLKVAVKVKHVTLKYEDGNSRFRGCGYVEFEDRASFVNVINESDLTIKGRRMRVEVATNHSEGRGGRGMRSSGNDDYMNQDWRSTSSNRERDDDSGGGFRSGRRDFGGGSSSSYGRRDERRGFGDRPSYRDRGGSGFSRGGDSDRDWRGEGGRETGERERWSNDRDRSYGGSGRSSGYDDRPRNEFSSWRREGGADRERDRDPPERSEPKTRPKIALQPRSIPLEEEVVKDTESATASIFGGAKPVNTAAREREIEERLARQSAVVDDTSRRRGTSSYDSWDRARDKGKEGEGRDRDRDRERDRDGDRDRERDRDGDRDRERNRDGDRGRERDRDGDRDRDRDRYRSDRDYDRYGDKPDNDRDDKYYERSRDIESDKETDYEKDKESSRDDDSRDDDDSQREPSLSNDAWRRSQPVNNGRSSPSGPSEDGEGQPKSRGTSPRPSTRDDSSGGDSVKKYIPPRGQSEKRGDKKLAHDERSKSGSSVKSTSSTNSKTSSQGSARPRETKKEDKDELSRLPKFQEQKAPNFAGSNKFASLDESNESTAN